MIKRLFLSLVLLISLNVSKATSDNWKIYPSYHNATYCQETPDKIYILASGSLFSYSSIDNELRTYDKISHLNDVNIKFIKYCKEIEALVIVYENTNIDLLYNDDTIYNISDFKDKTLSNKTINSLDITGSTAYLSTGFGIVELDLHKKEFKNTYTFNKDVYCTQPFNGYIYTSTNEGIFRGKLGDNLLDNSKWSKLNDYKPTAMAIHSGRLYAVVKNQGLIFLAPGSEQFNIMLRNGELLYVYSNGEELLTGSHKILFTIDNNHNPGSYTLDGEENNFILKNGKEIWSCKGYTGLVPLKIENKSMQTSGEAILPDSPVRNHCEYLKFSGDKLLVAGGNLSYLDNTLYDGTVMEYDYINEKWYNYPEKEIISTTGIRYKNVCTIDEDPTQEGHIMAGAFGTGLYEFKDGKLVAHYSMENSPLASAAPTSEHAKYYVRISKVKYDIKGNLWLLNTGTKTPFKILHNNGSWQDIYYKQLEQLPTVSDFLIDSRGWLWVVSLQSEAGLFCAKLNGTDSTDDDEIKTWFTKFTNQDGISYDIYQIYGFTEDRNGSIWVGTNIGLFKIENPKSFFDTGRFTQIKIPRNDGTGLADYLLSGVYIQCIVVDGANRKWIGTKYNGVYLISEDGLETIHHFTTENSPLPSNSVVSIALNDETGEVFIGTENGLTSFMSDATAPSQTLQENNIHAYPNPVTPDYSGNISIVGLTYDCNVKIVDTTGSLIYEGESTGGSFTWDGRNSKGNRVAAGVYYVLTYDSEGNEGVATKILFIR